MSSVKNNFAGFTIAPTGFGGDSDNDSDFGENLGFRRFGGATIF